MRVLVTGATGFIGRNLVDDLILAGHSVSALCRDPAKAAALLPVSVEAVPGDITDLPSLSVAASIPFEAVFHCAARVADTDWPALCRVNVLGTHNVCSLAKRLRVRRLVHLSSVAVVSGNPQVPLTEGLPFSATNLYGRSKIAAEKIVLEYRSQGVPAAIIRPSMVYGEGEPHMLDTVLWLLYWRLLPLINAGRNRMHLAYVKNVTRALVLALENQAFLEGSFFVADDEVCTVKEVFDIFSTALGRRGPVILPRWLTGTLKTLPGVEKKMSFFFKDRVYWLDALHRAGYSPVFTAAEGLRRSAADWLSRRKGGCV
jgi:2-alkyl-3-oxoalkanoate reductase